MRPPGSSACSLVMRMVGTPHRPQWRSRAASSALRVPAVVVGPVNLDDHGAAVAEHDEIGSAHARVAEFYPRQRQYGDRLPDRALPLDFREDLVDGKLGAAAEYQAVLGGVAPFCVLAPCLVGRRLPVSWAAWSRQSAEMAGSGSAAGSITRDWTSSRP